MEEVEKMVLVRGKRISGGCCGNLISSITPPLGLISAVPVAKNKARVALELCLWSFLPLNTQRKDKNRPPHPKKGK